MQYLNFRFYLELGRLTNLKCLNLSGNKFLRSQDVITLSINCRTLEDLRLLNIYTESSFGNSLKDNEMVFIASHLQPTLSTLKIDMHQLRNISYQVKIFAKLFTSYNFFKNLPDAIFIYNILGHYKVLIASTFSFGKLFTFKQ